MHLLGIMLAAGTGIYTLNWARTLSKRGNKVGGRWTVLLALVSTGLAWYYYYQHGFFP